MLGDIKYVRCDNVFSSDAFNFEPLLKIDKEQKDGKLLKYAVSF